MKPKTIAAPLALLACLTALWTGGCSSAPRTAMKPARIESRDVFTCKGLTEEGRWVGVTDVFMPQEDAQVVVAAKLASKDHDARIIYELTNPAGVIAVSEQHTYPREEILGIAFAMDRLLALGGEGEWRATVYSDGLAFGDKVFYLGEKPEEEEAEGEGFFVVGEESLQEAAAAEAPAPPSEEERYANSIREVTPELEIPPAIETGPDTTIEIPGF